MTRVFFSYSHDDDAHKAWVSDIAQDLSRRGLDVVLDQNDLKPGLDIHQFAELAVETSDFVLLICTPEYARKANNRVRGVGMEISLITSEIYSGASDKFIAILRHGGHEESIPRFMKSKLFVDLRDDANEEPWEQLCQHLIENGPASQIGTLFYEALFPFDEARIHNQPRLPELRRFTEFVEFGQTENKRWYVIRRDPIRRDLATIFFQNPE
ncbi:MAG: toll/interleukin-1 receptor domain-containing protein [Chloroflexi bacterium]|nr:MAG: toll/interleukin-1 receptor domain-containing protein [Chloroflexota bacterium]MBL1195593.1 toll/interleukin-1 receptor domain-containing protein [Chloroflexota bacterium]NOH12880.1 toll/interleukin-1 receptor domain-containing protein [Chloroflexota bacterium]